MKTPVLAFAFLTFGSCLNAQTSNPELSLLTQSPPAVDADIVELGRMLFFESRLSGDSSTSCADCHDPDLGWTDASELSRGYPGTKHWRNAQTIVNVGFLGGGFHRDSGLSSLNDQVVDAMGAGFVANIDAVMAEERLRQIPEYVAQFAEIWGEAPTMPRIAEAIATFENSLVSTDSPYDLQMAGQANAMSQSALRGMELFNGKANCSSCHSGVLASDKQFHNTSVPPNPAMAEDPLRQVTFRYLMRKFGIDETVYPSLDRDPGRYLVTHEPDDLGKFRTPPLRYLKYTAPYMHNGVFYTLDEVVDFYNFGGTQDVFQTKSVQVKPLGLNRDEKRDLVAFLESLSGTQVRVETPDLPDYQVQSFPQTSQQVNVAALRTVTDTATPVAPAAPENAGSIQLKPRVKETRASAAPKKLVLIPRNKQPETSALPETSDRITTIGGNKYVIVQSGDTLGDLARLVYGDPAQVEKLYEANRASLKNLNDIEEGMLLRIP